jgi:5-methylcytosine-specific restriction protein A
VQVMQTRYERNIHALRGCLNHYGYSCKVCGFDFENK